MRYRTKIMRPDLDDTSKLQEQLDALKLDLQKEQEQPKEEKEKNEDKVS